MEFEPEHFQQMAGLVCYYNAAKFHYLHVSHDEDHGRHLRVMSCAAGLAAGRRLHRAHPDSARAASSCASKWITSGCASPIRDGRQATGPGCPQQFDASILSDEATGPGFANFTGAFVGMACQDMAGTAHPADFDYFEYREREYLRELV